MQHAWLSTSTTPEVTLDLERGRIEMVGSSHSDDSLRFYEPIIDALNPEAIKLDKFEANIYLERFNTFSAKCLLDIFKNLGKLSEKGSSVKVNWFYNSSDTDMHDMGKDYAAIANVPVNLIEQRGTFQ